MIFANSLIRKLFCIRSLLSHLPRNGGQNRHIWTSGIFKHRSILCLISTLILVEKGKKSNRNENSKLRPICCKNPPNSLSIQSLCKGHMFSLETRRALVHAPAASRVMGLSAWAVDSPATRNGSHFKCAARLTTQPSHMHEHIKYQTLTRPVTGQWWNSFWLSGLIRGSSYHHFARVTLSWLLRVVPVFVTL